MLYTDVEYLSFVFLLIRVELTMIYISVVDRVSFSLGLFWWIVNDLFNIVEYNVLLLLCYYYYHHPFLSYISKDFIVVVYHLIYISVS